METILTSKEEIIDGEEVTVWYIYKGYGAIIINLNRILDEEISECTWLGTKQKYLNVDYTDWDENELVAILDADGQIARKGIMYIETFIEDEGLFIIKISGHGLGEEATYFNLASDDWKMAVIDASGKFIIEPEYDKIQFEEEENIFYAKNLAGEENKYSLNGKRCP